MAALLNPGDIEQSRILLAPLPATVGGWAQLAPAFAGREDKGWQELRSLASASLTPLPAHDLAGTCQQADCQCRACWVPQAEAAYRAAQQANAE